MCSIRMCFIYIPGVRIIARLEHCEDKGDWDEPIFAAYLKKHIFDIEEFPEYFYLLKQFEIRRIQVNFQLEGGKRLLAALDQQPPKPPANIALCWN